MHTLALLFQRHTIEDQTQHLLVLLMLIARLSFLLQRLQLLLLPAVIVFGFGARLLRLSCLPFVPLPGWHVYILSKIKMTDIRRSSTSVAPMMGSNSRGCRVDYGQGTDYSGERVGRQVGLNVS